MSKFLPMIKNMAPNKLTSKLEELKEYLAFSNSDSIVETHHLEKTQRYYKLRWELVW